MVVIDINEKIGMQAVELFELHSFCFEFPFLMNFQNVKLLFVQRVIVWDGLIKGAQWRCTVAVHCARCTVRSGSAFWRLTFGAVYKRYDERFDKSIIKGLIKGMITGLIKGMITGLIKGMIKG